MTMNLFTDYIHCNINEELADYLYPISKKILEETPEHPSYINGKTSYFFRSTPSQYEENLFPFYDYVLKNSTEYLKVLEVDIEKYNVEFKNIWFSEMYKYGSHETHVHQNNHLSGTFYINYNEENSKIRFYRPDHFHNSLSAIHFKKYNSYNSQVYDLPTEKGKLLIWQSSLMHGVLPNLSNNRIAISFNLNLIKK
jgi:uncharacterized protein (TIGR02466 family)